jgi:hypothetical protein
MYADEWYRINIATAKNEVIFTICVCTKQFQSDSNLTYASIQSGFVCPKLEKKGIATKIVGVLDDLREMGFINKVVITDRSDLIDPGITVGQNIYEIPKIKDGGYIMTKGKKVNLNEITELFYLEGRIFMKDLETGTILEWTPKERIDQDYLNAIINDNDVEGIC